MQRSKELTDLILAATVTWGPERQASVVAEECAELIKAIAKARRQGQRLTDWILQEMVDVQIMLWQMDCIVDKVYGIEMNRRAVNTMDVLEDPVEMMPGLAELITVLPGLIMHDQKFKPDRTYLSDKVAKVQFYLYKLENSFLALDKIPGADDNMKKSIECELVRKTEHLHDRLERHGVKL